MDDIIARTDREYFMTGLLTSVTPISNIQIPPKQVFANTTGQSSAKNFTANKQDIFIKILSGDSIRISIWENFFDQLNIQSLLQLQNKPIIVIAGTTIKSYMGEKFLSTSSASKIYINLDIPETAQLKERFQEEASTIELISNKEIDMGHFKAHEMKIEDLHYLNAKEIKGQKFKVHAKINGINMRKGWYYKSCSICTFRVDDGNDSFNCSRHGLTTPKLVMRLNLTLEDESEKLEAVVFGALAEKLSRYQLTSSVISKGVHNDQLPEELKAIINEEYIFTVGLTDQASDQVLLKYKIFAFSSNSPAPVRDNKFKGKDIAESKYKDDETEDAAILTSDAIPTDLFCDESPAKKLKPSF